MTIEDLQKLEEVKQKICEIIPEIKELKNGCQIRPKNQEGLDKLYKFEWGDDKGEHEHFPVTILEYTPHSETYEERELIEGKMVVGWDDPFGAYVVRHDARDFLFIDDDEEDIEILGRDIRLADVLRAIGNTGALKINNLGGFSWFTDNEWKNIATPRWDLSKDRIDDQSPECIDFIHSLICN